MKMKRSGLLLFLLLSLQGAMAAGSLVLDPIAEHVAVTHLSDDEKIAWELNEVLKPLADGSGSVVHPWVKAGMVRLQGSSPSRDAIRHLLEVAANVPGVREVRSEMSIRPI
jgi:osmotically-inducible protein OsmY